MKKMMYVVLLGSLASGLQAADKRKPGEKTRAEEESSNIKRDCPTLSIISSLQQKVPLELESAIRKIYNSTILNPHEITAKAMVLRCAFNKHGIIVLEAFERNGLDFIDAYIQNETATINKIKTDPHEIKKLEIEEIDQEIKRLKQEIARKREYWAQRRGKCSVGNVERVQDWVDFFLKKDYGQEQEKIEQKIKELEHNKNKILSK